MFVSNYIQLVQLLRRALRQKEKERSYVCGKVG